MIECLPCGHAGESLASGPCFERPCAGWTVRHVLETDQHLGLPCQLIDGHAAVTWIQEARVVDPALAGNWIIQLRRVLGADCASKRDDQRGKNNDPHIALMNGHSISFRSSY